MSEPRVPMGCDDVRDLAAGFVLGALTPEEEAAVRDHLSTCPEPHPEIAELGGVVPYLAESLEPVEPPAGLKARLLAAAAAERPEAADGTSAEAVAAPLAPTAPPAAPIPFPTAAERTARAERRRGLGSWALGLAAVLAIALLGTWNLQLQSRLDAVTADLAAARAYQEGVAAVLEVATQPGASTAFFTPAAPGTSATGVGAAGPDGTVVISMRDLAPTTGTEVYEAWVIVGTDNPVPLGSFTVGDEGTGVFEGSTPLATPGAALAFTREPAPGATRPTLPVITLGLLNAADS